MIRAKRTKNGVERERERVCVCESESVCYVIVSTN